jgi:uncharacterized protein
MEVRRHQDYRRMPWKNGGGETAEIAVFPEGATLDDFDWRISMATVSADGPFSLFPGVDRTLSVLEGDGPIIDLNVMTRRGRFRHHVSRMPLTETTVLVRHGALMLILIEGGEADLVADAGSVRAGRGDTVIFHETDGTALTVRSRNPLTLYVIDLWPA